MKNLLIENQKGISLVEIMVAAGISAVIALGTMKMNQTSQQAMREVTTKNDLNSFFTNKLSSALAQSDNCINAWDLNADGTADPVIIAEGGSLGFRQILDPVTSQPLVTRTREIGTMGEFRVNNLTLYRQGNSCSLELDLTRTNTSGNESKKIGAKRKIERLALTCAWNDSTDELVSCSSLGPTGNGHWTLLSGGSEQWLENSYGYAYLGSYSGAPGTSPPAPLSINPATSTPWGIGMREGIALPFGHAIRWGDVDSTNQGVGIFSRDQGGGNEILYFQDAEDGNFIRTYYDETEIINGVFKVSQDGIEANGQLYIPGTSDGSIVPTTGTGQNHFLWLPSKRALSAGLAHDGWTTAAMGDYSAAIGEKPRAMGHAAFAAGREVVAQGASSAAFGYGTVAGGYASAAFGHGNSASIGGAFVTGGFNVPFTLGDENQAAGLSSAVVGGIQNRSTGSFSFVTNRNNRAVGDNSAVFGSGNVVHSRTGFVTGGANEARPGSGSVATLIGGSNNYISSTQNNNTIVGGMLSNIIETASNSTIIGSGMLSSIRGNSAGSVIVGGGNNSINNANSAVVIGVGGRANHMRTVVVSSGVISTDSIDQFASRFDNGYKFCTNSTCTQGVRISSSGTATVNGVAITSDRNAKEDFQDINDEEFLDSLSELELSSWVYKDQKDKSKRRVGPMAQDFYRLFSQKWSLHSSETQISMNDIDGVLLASAKALEKRTRSLSEENTQLKSRVKKLENDNKELLKRLERIEAALEDQ